MGTLTIKVVKGELFKGSEILTKMDPFVKLLFNGQTFHTKVMQEGSKVPRWNESFTFVINSMSD